MTPAEPTTRLTAEEIEELRADLVTEIIALGNYSDDPMWVNHAEVPKAWLKRWLSKLSQLPRLLAEHIAMTAEIERLKKGIVQLEEFIGRREDDILSIAREREAIHIERDAKSDEISDLRRQLAEKDAELSDLRQLEQQAVDKAVRQIEELANLRHRLVEANAEIERLKRKELQVPGSLDW